MNISVTCSHPALSDSTINVLKTIGDVKLLPGKKLSEKLVIERIPNTNILICDDSSIERIGEITLKGLKRLELVVIYGVGFEWIDIKLATELGVIICNTKGCNAQSTAEHIWGMIFGLSKRIPELERATRNNFNINIDDYKGFEVYDKTLGIIGLGDVGQRVAKMGSVICKRIIGVNKSQRNVEGVEIVQFKYLLRNSDVIVLCLPLNDETRWIIGEDELNIVKNGAILVNCAREQLVDKKAVLCALKKDKIFGYGLETNIMETVSSDDSYFNYENVILTPHNGWNTIESDTNSFSKILEIVKSYVLKRPLNVINYAALIHRDN